MVLFHMPTAGARVLKYPDRQLNTRVSVLGQVSRIFVFADTLAKPGVAGTMRPAER